MGDAEFTSLWRIRKTVHQMLRDRKYVVSQEELTRSKDSFKENFSPPEGSLFAREQLTVLTHKLDDPDDLVRRRSKPPRARRRPPLRLDSHRASLPLTPRARRYLSSSRTRRRLG